MVKTQEEEQEEGCLTRGDSEEEDEKDDEDEKEHKKYERLKQRAEDEKESTDEEEEEESEEDEEPVTEEEDDEEEEENDNKSQPEPMNGPSLLQAQANNPTLKPQRAEPVRLTPPPPPPPPPPVDPNATGNPTVVDDALQKVLSNDPEVTEVNLNNIDDVSQVQSLSFFFNVSKSHNTANKNYLDDQNKATGLLNVYSP